MTMSARLPQSAAGGAQWRWGGHRPGQGGRPAAGVGWCADRSGPKLSAEAKERKWEGPAIGGTGCWANGTGQRVQEADTGSAARRGGVGYGGDVLEPAGRGNSSGQ